MSRLTIKDVAAEAGVSTATVSRALSGARGVTPDHKQLVEDTAARLGYRPHAIARALRESKTMVVGMVVPGIDNPFFPQLVELAEAELRSRGRALILTSSHDDPDLEARQVAMLLDRQVDGLLISACSKELSGKAIEKAASAVPTVQFDQFADDTTTAFVGVDDASGMAQVIHLAQASGHKQLAYIGAGTQNWSGARRMTAFQESVSDINPEALNRVYLGSFTREYGRNAAQQLLRDHPGVDTIVCGNDLIAVGVMDVARERGLNVPKDLSVSGFDDISVATVSNPALTTVKQPSQALMSTAVDLLIRAINGEDTSRIYRELPVSLVERESLTFHQ
jgi:LacI family transcriptional regulator